MRSQRCLQTFTTSFFTHHPKKRYGLTPSQHIRRHDMTTDIQLVANVIGYIASICMVLGYLPQTVRTIKTRSTDDIAMGTFLLMGIGGLFFAIQGLLLDNWPLFLCNLFTTIMSAIIFGIKMYNDHFKKK